MRGSPSSFPPLALALALAAGAAAQEAAPPAPTSPPTVTAGEVEEILVTITKRDEALQDVPASVSAFSPQTIALANLEGADDLASLIPNVVTKGESRTGNFSIRGVSESFSSQSPVAYHVTACSSRGSIRCSGSTTTSPPSRSCAARRAPSTAATPPRGQSTSAT